VKPLFTLDLLTDGAANGLSVLTDDFGRTNYYALINSELVVTDSEVIISAEDFFSIYKPSGSVINNIQKSFGVYENKINTRRSNQDTSVVESYVSSSVFHQPQVF